MGSHRASTSRASQSSPCCVSTRTWANRRSGNRALSAGAFGDVHSIDQAEHTRIAERRAAQLLGSELAMDQGGRNRKRQAVLGFVARRRSPRDQAGGFANVVTARR